MRDRGALIAGLIARVIAAPDEAAQLQRVSLEVAEVARAFPAPGLAMV